MLTAFSSFGDHRNLPPRQSRHVVCGTLKTKSATICAASKRGQRSPHLQDVCRGSIGGCVRVSLSGDFFSPPHKCPLWPHHSLSFNPCPKSSLRLQRHTQLPGRLSSVACQIQQLSSLSAKREAALILSRRFYCLPLPSICDLSFTGGGGK